MATKLRRLSRALPSALMMGDFAARVESLTGSAAEVEKELETLDRELLQALERSLSRIEIEDLDTRLGAAMTKLERRLSPASIESSRRELRERILRETYAVPLLSLFAPEADQES